MDGVGKEREGRERKRIKGEVRDSAINSQEYMKGRGGKKYKREHNHLHDD